MSNNSSHSSQGGTFPKSHSLVLVGGLLAVALLFWAAWTFAHPQTEGGLVAKVTADGQVICTLPLSEDVRYVVQSEDGTNTVVVAEGAAHIEDADCPGGDCMRQGAISRVGQMLVCLPHKMFVEVVTADDAGLPSTYTGGVGDIDGIAR